MQYENHLSQKLKRDRRVKQLQSGLSSIGLKQKQTRVSSLSSLHNYNHSKIIRNDSTERIVSGMGTPGPGHIQRTRFNENSYLKKISRKNSPIIKETSTKTYQLNIDLAPPQEDFQTEQVRGNQSISSIEVASIMTPQKDLFSLQKLPPRRNKYLNVKSKIDNTRGAASPTRQQRKVEVSPHQIFRKNNSLQRSRMSQEHISTIHQLHGYEPDTAASMVTLNVAA